jgi:triosephosphate isomerase
MSERKTMIAGNWKMNLNFDESTTLVKTIAGSMGELEGIEVLVAPPFTSLAVVKEAIGDARMFLAAQNMHWETSGAYTGEVSGTMLVEAGCKVRSAVSAGLIPITCIGETLEEREGDRAFEVIKKQLDESLKNFRDDGTMPSSTILAYEPVWAIGTGQTATAEQAQEVHHFIRQWIEENFDQDTAELIRILYGGSVKPDNAADLMSRPDIDGALVGGASLNVDSFISIIQFRGS